MGNVNANRLEPFHPVVRVTEEKTGVFSSKKTRYYITYKDENSQIKAINITGKTAMASLIKDVIMDRIKEKKTSFALKENELLSSEDWVKVFNHSLYKKISNTDQDHIIQKITTYIKSAKIVPSS